MGAFKYIKESFEQSYKTRSDEYKKRITSWRESNTVTRSEKPTNPVRARELGYKAKKGIIIARVRVLRGKRSRRKASLGRKPGKNVKKMNPGIPLTQIAERKALEKFRNMDAVNSYFVGNDGSHQYIEVILKEKQPN